MGNVMLCWQDKPEAYWWTLPFHSGSELKVSVPKKIHFFLKHFFENIFFWNWSISFMSLHCSLSWKINWSGKYFSLEPDLILIRGKAWFCELSWVTWAHFVPGLQQYFALCFILSQRFVKNIHFLFFFPAWNIKKKILHEVDERGKVFKLLLLNYLNENP